MEKKTGLIDPCQKESMKTSAFGADRDETARGAPRSEGKQGQPDSSRTGARTEQAFSLGPGASQRTLMLHLRKRFSLRRLPRTSSHLSYYDTFDGRIRAGGMRLSTREGGHTIRLALEPLDGGRAPVLDIEKVPGFASDLPPGPMRRRLRKLAKVRRLVPFARIELTTSGYAVLDDEEKTVVRLFFDSVVVRDPAESGRMVNLATTMRVTRIEGYARDHSRVLACLAERRGLSPIQAELAERALQALGRKPARRRSGLEAPLDAQAPSGLAFLTLQRGLFEVMRNNEHGICADLDIEHLHDFRVAMRRSRVLHRIFKEEIQGSGFEALLPGLKWLGGISGPTRDLDVHLVELLEQEQDAGPEGKSLLPLIALLRERRQEEWTRLAAALNSTEHVEFVERASALLESPDSEAAGRVAASGPPLAQWVSDHIAKAHRRLLKHGRRIDPRSPDAMLHAVRIDGKRLRYLLEFFRGVYADDAMKKLIKELERLQENLGRFNDACVQRETLRELAHDLDRIGLGNVDTLLAIGRLVERAETRRETERANFEDRFARFESRETRRRFRVLFGAGEPARERDHEPEGSVDALTRPSEENDEIDESDEEARP